MLLLSGSYKDLKLVEISNFPEKKSYSCRGTGPRKFTVKVKIAGISVQLFRCYNFKLSLLD